MKRLQIFFIFCIALIPLKNVAEKLDDFNEDFEFIVKNGRMAEQLSAGAKYRNDFYERLFRALKDAGNIQQVATEIGINEITLGKLVREMADTFNTGTRKELTRDQYDIRRFAIADIRQQIRYLQDLQFSYEEKSFVPTQLYMDEQNVELRFIRRWQKCKEISTSKTALSKYTINQYKKRYFHEILRLARMIDEGLKKQKIEISDRYKLLHNVTMFVKDWEINAEFFGKNQRSGTRIRITPDVNDRLNEMKLLGIEIENDLNLLAATDFELYLPASKFAKNKLDKLNRKEQKSPESPESEKKKKMIKLDMEELTKLYDRKKQELYQAESKMNGVSSDFYDNYRKILPDTQKKELDQSLELFLSESYPPALARSTAVKKIHLKYTGKNHKCSAEEIVELLEINPEEVQK